LVKSNKQAPQFAKENPTDTTDPSNLVSLGRTARDAQADGRKMNY